MLFVVLGVFGVWFVLVFVLVWGVVCLVLLGGFGGWFLVGFGLVFWVLVFWVWVFGFGLFGFWCFGFLVFGGFVGFVGVLVLVCLGGCLVGFGLVVVGFWFWFLVGVVWGVGVVGFVGVLVVVGLVGFVGVVGDFGFFFFRWRGSAPMKRMKRPTTNEYWFIFFTPPQLLTLTGFLEGRFWNVFFSMKVKDPLTLTGFLEGRFWNVFFLFETCASIPTEFLKPARRLETFKNFFQSRNLFLSFIFFSLFGVLREGAAKKLQPRNFLTA